MSLEDYQRLELRQIIRGKGNWSTYKAALAWRGFQTDLDEEEILTLLTEALEGHLRYEPRVPDYHLHEECHDCDQGLHRHWSTGEWMTHCVICDETWPCPDAGQVDQSAIKRDQQEYLHLESRDRTFEEESHFWYLYRTLAKAGFLPTTDPSVP